MALDSLVKLIADLLNVSRIESGRFAYNKTKLDIVSLVKNIAAEFTHTAKTKNLIFKLNFPKDKEIFILADKEKLFSALEDIFENAFLYTSKGSVTATIINRKKGVTLEIEDTGMGIPKDQLPFIFGKFFRAKNVVKKQIQGTGLGLYLAKTILNAQEAKIELRSAPDSGTTVSMTFPHFEESRKIQVTGSKEQ